jgi:hypothetical protein
MVFDNRTHRAFAYRRTGKKSGRLRWSGLGYIESDISPEEIAAMFEGEAIDADMVRKIQGYVKAHLFVEMIPYHGGTGYYCLIPKETTPPRIIPEPDDPREDPPEEGDEILPDN